MCGTDLVRGDAQSGEWMGLEAAVDRNRVPTVPVEVMRICLERWDSNERKDEDEHELSPPCAVVVVESAPVDHCGDGSGVDVKVETTFLPMVCFRTVVIGRENDYLCLTTLMPLT
ncbi:hypothetical protein HanPSC8_Chr15g0692101 [Helianthus annuus]|nr:hypothetical protein HanPSC8_Chr15g0692101 [Helianthus annuus]